MIRLIALLSLGLAFSVLAERGLSPKVEQPLLQFAQANCLYQYFSYKNYDLKDIRSISAGIVQMSHIPADKFVEVNELVRNYEPQIQYKKETSPLLVKCFTLESDPAFLKKLSRVSERD
ncbi:TPA: hypothetical protein P0E23_002081 [Vibrio harveyi]|nr:hypothetical protein [Vibrio harveyi]